MTIPYLDARGRRSELRCPRLPPPLHLLAAVLGWDALRLRDRLSVLKMARPILAARKAIARDRTATLTASELTVSRWLEQAGQNERLREWLWDPLAVAALNQSPDEAAAASFVRVLALLFGPEASDAALVLPTRPLHLAYAEPARTAITRHGGEVRTGALARVAMGTSGKLQVDVRGERVAVAPVISAVPWFALGALFGPVTPEPLGAVIANASSMESKPIVTVNLWYDMVVMDDPFVGLPGRTMQWVFDKRAIVRGQGFEAGGRLGSDITPFARIQRRRSDRAAARRCADRDGRRGNPGCAPRRAARTAHARDGDSREARDILACARSADAPGHSHARTRPLSRGRLDRDMASRHDRERCHQRSPGCAGVARGLSLNPTDPNGGGTQEIRRSGVQKKKTRKTSSGTRGSCACSSFLNS